MSRSSTTSVPKNPTPLPAKSAWARGPPQPVTVPSPRSQSPAPPSTPVHQTHSRRPSTLGQGVPVKDGVSVPQSNVGAVKQGSTGNFGSIDASAPISSSRPLKSDSVKFFGSVPASGHINDKASTSSRPVLSSTALLSIASTLAAPSSTVQFQWPSSDATAPAKPKIDIKKMFQNPSSAPSSSPPSHISSPLMRNAGLPSQSLSTHPGTFVPRKITSLTKDGVEPDLENLKNGPATPSNRRPTSVRMESTDQRNQRLVEEGANQKKKAPAEKKAKRSETIVAAAAVAQPVQDGRTVESNEESGISPRFTAPISPARGGRSRPGHTGVKRDVITPFSTEKNVISSPLDALGFQSPEPGVVNLSVQGQVPTNLTLENLDSTSDQIINWINNSDCRALFHVTRLILTKTTQEPVRCEIYARLCRNMMERISPEIQDDGIQDNEGKSIAGGKLFRKYLLDLCREDFEHVWVANDDPVSVDIVKSMGDGKDEPIDQRIPTRNRAPNLAGLGLIEFITELFKLQMLPERFMYGCLEQLLVEVGNPEEERIEALCRLLTTCGSILDKPKARGKFNACFTRIRELTRSPIVSSRTKSLVQSVIELRENKWMARTFLPKPSDISFPGETLEAKSVTLKPTGDFAGKTATGNNHPISSTNPSSDMFLGLSSQPGESSKTPATGTTGFTPEAHFNALVAQIQWKLVEKFASHSAESRSPDAKLVASFFSRSVAKDPFMASAFGEEFAPIGELINDVDIDLQGAVGLFASLIRGSDSDKATGSDLSKYRM